VARFTTSTTSLGYAQSNGKRPGRYSTMQAMESQS
jgi:hypothetical protein